MLETDLQKIEMDLLLEGIFRVHGHDFRDYAEASLHRRLRKWLGESPYATFSEAQGILLRDPRAFQGLIRGLAVRVTEMFRDPKAFRAVREEAFPHLRTYPFLKVWVAGCATGEEIYSMAILLEEEGFGQRYRIYATDLEAGAVEAARSGAYPLRDLQRFTQNYQQAGGRTAFSDYYTVRFEQAHFDPRLREHVVFSTHNLAVDAAFGEMHLVLCRNVLIYFKPVLKARVLELLDASTLPGGFLMLGQKESLGGTPLHGRYTETSPTLRLYRKRYVPADHL